MRSPGRRRLGPTRLNLVVAVLAGVAVALALVLSAFAALTSAARSVAFEQAVVRAERVAASVVGPYLDDDLLAGDAEALAELDAVTAARKADSSVLRVKVWDESGTILYSDEPQLVGQRFPLGLQELAVLRDGGSIAHVMHSPTEENAFEDELMPLLEVYTSAVASTGQPLLVETYVPTHDLEDTPKALVSRARPPLLAMVLASGSGAALGLVVLRRRELGNTEPPATGGDADDAPGASSAPVLHQLAADRLARRQLASGLRDQLMQDLAAVGYVLETVERASPAETRTLLQQAGAALRSDLSDLRQLTDRLDCDPVAPSRDEAGLPAGTLALLRHAAGCLAETAWPAGRPDTVRDERGDVVAELTVRPQISVCEVIAVAKAIESVGGTLVLDDPSCRAVTRATVRLPAF